MFVFDSQNLKLKILFCGFIEKLKHPSCKHVNLGFSKRLPVGFLKFVLDSFR